ncbi:MAG: ribosome maturation factor RimM [Anaerolineae bacterium]
MKVITDYPERLMEIRTLFVGQDYHPYQVERIRRHRTAGMLIQFKGITSRDQAEELRSQMVHIRLQDAVPLEEGEYYLFQLHNLLVVTDTGEELGIFTGYLETGANDVYIVTTPEGREILLPAIPDVIKKVDIQAGVITVHLLDGLI